MLARPTLPASSGRSRCLGRPLSRPDGKAADDGRTWRRRHGPACRRSPCPALSPLPARAPARSSRRTGSYTWGGWSERRATAPARHRASRRYPAPAAATRRRSRDRCSYPDRARSAAPRAANELAASEPVMADRRLPDRLDARRRRWPRLRALQGPAQAEQSGYRASQTTCRTASA